MVISKQKGSPVSRDLQSKALSFPRDKKLAEESDTSSKLPRIPFGYGMAKTNFQINPSGSCR